MWNPNDPVSGFAAIPRNMTCIATKLKSAGYKTHQVGKWDAGMATPDHTPHGRGYDTSFGYVSALHEGRSMRAAPRGSLYTGRSTRAAPRRMLHSLVSHISFFLNILTCAQY